MRNCLAATTVYLIVLAVETATWFLSGSVWFWVVFFAIIFIVAAGLTSLRVFENRGVDGHDLKLTTTAPALSPEPRTEPQPAPQGATTTEGSEMERIALPAALAALVTTVFVPVLYLLGLDHVELRGTVVSLVSIGLITFAVDALLNIASGMTKQTSPMLNRIDSWMTRVRTISVTGTLIIVLLLFYRTADPTVHTVMAIPNAWTLLFVLTGFTWFDLIVIQVLFKNRRLAKFTARAAEMTSEGGTVPDKTVRLKSRSGKPEFSVQPRILVEDPVYVVRDGDGYVEMNGDNLPGLNRLVLRSSAFLANPASVPTNIIELGPGDYATETTARSNLQRADGNAADERGPVVPAADPGDGGVADAAPRTVN